MEIKFDFDSWIRNTLGLVEIDRTKRQDNAIVCKHWLRGLCKKGDVCEFLHVYALDKMPECWFFSKYGECSNQDCLFLHIDPNSKSKECIWYNRGFCRHGNSCRNKHYKKRMCFNYEAGFCPLGKGCPYGHPKFEIITAEYQRAEQQNSVISKPTTLLTN
ncbi:cleavage and polyadenylation specificity factor subunit 4 [Nematocida parisii]|uniref:mRNA 3'-end-processing protein n=1 Tax=Nematocida parisii (strain ERTm3) TaxID=935791 RepID=I3EG95_NEMP3|nr:zinc finger protein [Nematocida parisii ERTm1]EIJ88242.1 zinc finger protein [Nematocida parisii ERTm3]KAI5125373.1 cleavage and polyadenylation specificity factor subunit 4 [Nematocida parisii]EIJ93692.1 zinc finger protein [Nematocida parisii ERTm1]KAI5125497.1 cleavage and polyadenylation specificity factor subunit 4 [Nematocida parisii]KAI5140621.1 cleavage and polyadenylation specificity factor subunit 4 [Nematocida parisii]|eukprot:XP_013059092.1 zinc finger protein [Nematocida parisii ERTm1]